jgi:hypothetical protein
MHVGLEILTAVVTEKFSILGYNILYSLVSKPTFWTNIKFTKTKTSNLLIKNFEKFA